VGARTWLRAHWAPRAKGAVYHQINVASPGGWQDDYRIPDLVLLTPGRTAIDRDTHFEGGPDAVVEIRTPGDETGRRATRSPRTDGRGASKRRTEPSPPAPRHGPPGPRTHGFLSGSRLSATDGKGILSASPGSPPPTRDRPAKPDLPAGGAASPRDSMGGVHAVRLAGRPSDMTTMNFELERLRNIGISAHIDSGKTTLTERILFYTKRIHAMHEVRGKDGVGATMDSMELERERGITIASAATFCEWLDHRINIIDTPGHVDFTIEVERSLRVLDGAVLILCAVAGVQSQSITVDRQMRRYNVPRLAFVNKCDRIGANPARVTEQLREKLKLNAVLLQLPIGLEANHTGVIDLVRMKAIYFDDPEGTVVREEQIPEAYRVEAEARREALLEEVSNFDDELLEALLEDPASVTEEMVHRAVRAGVLKLELCPVFVGSAYKNKGVQPLLDAVVHYLPCPTDVENLAIDPRDESASVPVTHDEEDPTLAYAFKIEDGAYGQLTYLRIYQGRVAKGAELFNARTGKKVKIGRIGRMHADKMEDILEASAGDIVALFGIDCASGDTFRSPETELTLTSMFVPDPVIHLALRPLDRKATDNMSKALARFSKEDPTFRTRYDEKAGETVISGMGELHLEVYVERMRREYNAAVEVGAPQVAYRERITKPVCFDYTHKKQTGGSGQYGRIIGRLEPAESGEFEFESAVTGGNVPREYIPSVEKGFRQSIERGTFIGAPLAGLKVTLEDGAAHSVDSSDMAFQTAARGAFREFYPKGKPQALEPIMNVSIEGPSEFQGEMVGTVLQRRGVLVGTTEDEGFVRIEAEVPLAEMFGYATALRSATQGKAEFSMEFHRYAPAPQSVQEELVKAYREELEKKKKQR